MYQNAGEKGREHPDPDDPPRRRANQVKGHGTWDNDRPPVAGVVGRESGVIGLQVCQHSDRQTLQPFVEAHTRDDATVYTDVREVHCNTMEGIWTGLRNFLRPFRGVNKTYLNQYTATFQVAHNSKRIALALLRAMMLPFTFEAT
jgi:transposase